MKTTKRVENWTNPESGETKTFVTISKHGGDDPEFLKVYQAFTAKVIIDLLGGRMGDCGPLGVMMWFLNRLMGHKVNSDPIVFLVNGLDDIATDLQISARQIARYIKTLQQGNYIEQVRPRTYAYRINPNFIYKGEQSTYFRKYVQPSLLHFEPSKEKLGDERTSRKSHTEAA